MLLINNLMTVAHRRYIEIDVDNDAHQSCKKSVQSGSYTRYTAQIWEINWRWNFFRLNAGNGFGIAWIYGAHSHRIVY